MVDAGRGECVDDPLSMQLLIGVILIGVVFIGGMGLQSRLYMLHENVARWGDRHQRR
jgi:hypothetical protein